MAVAAVVLAPAALAAPDQKKMTGAKEVHCAVMTNNTVNVKDATAKKMFSDYKGRRYFFCCAGCPAQFKADPAKFAKSDSIPTPKAAKGKKA
jgi:YHS domain-containing protein